MFINSGRKCIAVWVLRYSQICQMLHTHQQANAMQVVFSKNVSRETLSQQVIMF